MLAGLNLHTLPLTVLGKGKVSLFQLRASVSLVPAVLSFPFDVTQASSPWAWLIL